MLRSPIGESVRIITHGFLLAAEVEEGSKVTSKDMAYKLSDALTGIEGVGRVEVEYLGEIEVVGEDVLDTSMEAVNVKDMN